MIFLASPRNDFYCNNANIVLAFSSFQVGSLFSVKDPIPDGLRSCVVYKFSCAGCAACYVGENTRHFNTRVRQHLQTDRASHNFKHLESSSAVALHAPVIIFPSSIRHPRGLHLKSKRRCTYFGTNQHLTHIHSGKTC